MTRCLIASVCCWLLLTAVVGGEPNGPSPHLVFNAGGHTAAVNKVRFSSDGERLFSVSNDKTVRIWDLATGESRDVLRPPIGPGLAGALYALDVSPDDRWLATGGYEFVGHDHGVYLVDLAQGTMRAVLRGHTNVIIDLAFSPDGRLLASASADRTVRLWDLKTQEAVATLRGHEAGVYRVAFSPDGRQLASASLDGSVRLWSPITGEAIRVLSGHRGPVQALAWNTDGSLLASGSADQSIRIWSPEGRQLRHLTGLGNHVTSLRFPPDAGRLLYTLGGPEARDGGFVLNLGVTTGPPRNEASFTLHANSVLDGTLTRDGRLAATADADGTICVWQARTGQLVQRLASPGQRPWSAAWLDDRTIAWGTTSDYRSPNERGPLEQAFELETLHFTSLAERPERPRHRAVVAAPNVSLALRDEATLRIHREGNEDLLLSPFPDQRQVDQIRCFTLLDDQTIAIGSDQGLVLANVRSGQRQPLSRGHTGTVWALAPSPDGRYLLTVADDRSLRVWDWRRGRLVLSCFFVGRQWIAWTPEGYYAASPAGEQLMGWQIDSSRNQLGAFHPAAQFRPSLYRPDLIRQLLEAGSVERVLAREAAAAATTPRVTQVAEVLPPVVEITSPATHSLTIHQPELTVRARAQSRGEQPVLRLRLLLDGRPYEGQKGLYVVPLQPSPEASAASSSDVTGEWSVQLAPGAHRLAVQAETSASRSLSAEVLVDHQPVARAAETSSPLPDLYVLAVGVAQYDGPLKLAYADRDAEALVETLRVGSLSLFRNIESRVLTNQQATQREMLRGLTWLRRQMTQRDVCVVFFSGHGAKDETNQFYLVPVDADPQDLLATGLSGTQFKDALAAIPGRVLVLLDACHAGAAGGDRRKAVAGLTDDLVRDLATDDYGVIVMCSSMGREFSMESDDHRQGYFTVALVEAFQGQADYNRDGVVYVTEVDTYVADRVKQLTGGQQHPVTSKPATIRAFPVSLVTEPASR